MLPLTDAIEQTYKPDQRREGDPQEVDYLLGVAHAVMGDLERAKGLIGQNGDSASTALAAADTSFPPVCFLIPSVSPDCSILTAP